MIEHTRFEPPTRAADDDESLRCMSSVALPESMLRDMIERFPEAIVVHRRGQLLYGNAASVELLQADSLAQLKAIPLIAWIHVDDRDLLARQIEALGKGGNARSTAVTCRLSSRESVERFAEIESVLIDPSGERVIQTMLRDVTANVRAERELHHQAFHDTLTGLSNRALFHDRVNHAIARVQREGSPRERVAVLLLDLDRFKSVNDNLGHGCGDALLGAVASRLLVATRGSDTVARLSGDEFVVLLEDVSSDAHAAMVADRIVEAMRQPFMLNGLSVAMGVSIGVASAADADSADALLRNADLALYAAKAQGRGRFVPYLPSMHDAAVERLAVESELRLAVDHLEHVGLRNDGELRLMYQPVFDLTSGCMTGVEALLRWTRPGHGAVLPPAFIPVAEESGLIVPLGAWVLQHACRQAMAWDRLGTRARLGISVNVSRRQFQDVDFLDVVKSALASSGLEPSRLMLEITETLMMDDEQLTLSRLRELRALGVRVAVDDFGTGYTSLSYLKQFPVDFLKIDQRFIRSAGIGADDSVIAHAIVTLSAAFSLGTIAEGIETVEQLEQLRAMGCERGQGYLFAHPLTAEDVAERLVMEGMGRSAA